MRPLAPASLFKRRTHRLCLSWLIALASLVVNFAEARADISAGLGHSCELYPSGAVACWGLNDMGQLGDGGFQDRPTPATVTGLGGTVVALEAGDSFTCALLASGTLKCWGDNSQGQLGNGTTTSSAAPTTVANLSGPVTSFSAGRQQACAVLSNNDVLCWGNNVYGQLGDGSTTGHPLPSAVVLLDPNHTISTVSSGDRHSCGLTTEGHVLCWGDNLFGQLGNGTTADSFNPTPVTGLAGGVSEISAGGLHSCALSITGEVFCWGDNFFGQLGNSTVSDHLTPTPVVGLAGPAQTIDAGDAFNCAILVSGVTQCWGDNFDGQLGINSTVESPVPSDVNNLESGVTEIGLGAFHACARTSLGPMYCWGDNFFGQLGNLEMQNALTPVQLIEDGPPSVVTSPLPISLTSRIAVAALFALIGGYLSRRRTRGNSEIPPLS